MRKRKYKNLDIAKKLNKNTITVKNNKKQKSGGMKMKKTRKIIIFTVIIFIGLIIRNICNTKKQRSRSTIKIRLKRNRSNANTNETKKMGLLHRKY